MHLRAFRDVPQIRYEEGVADLGIITSPPNAVALRRFGLSVGGVLVLLGAASWWRGHAIAPIVFAALGCTLLVPGVLAPTLLAPVERYWMQGAAALGNFNTRILLGVFYFLLVAPVGLFRRLFGDPLNRSLRGPQTSNWSKRNPKATDLARYQRQF